MIDTKAVLFWFRGAARANAEVALANVQLSMAQGYWEPGVSRAARAALSKANVAAKIAKALPDRYYFGHEKKAYAYGDKEGTAAWHATVDRFEAARTAAHKLSSAMTYGGAPGEIDLAALEAAARPGAELAFAEAGRPFVKAFAPLWEAMAILDATRPPPVFTSLGVSPTITGTVVGMDMNLATLRMCPLKTVRWTRTDPKTGKVIHGFDIVLDWPKGTIFRASKFAARRSCCHACGHKISNGYNWVPLLVDNTAGQPQALWVGRDCSKSLCGIDVKGEVAIEVREGLAL